LRIPLADYDAREHGLDAAIVNAKGFGGNNASGLVLSARVTEAMLERRYADHWSAYRTRREHTRELAAAYEQRADRGLFAPIYRFGEGAIQDEDVQITSTAIRVPGFGCPISLDVENPYADMI
jgi:acetoacetyl-[acyl-carrier protein] synthase